MTNVVVLEQMIVLKLTAFEAVASEADDVWFWHGLELLRKQQNPM